VTDGAGARSQLSPVVAALLALVTVLFLMPVFTNVPEAVLAALIIHAVARLWKIAEFRANAAAVCDRVKELVGRTEPHALQPAGIELVRSTR
jgi:SulP family sulfate permease